METWVILSLISAFCLATSDALTKRILTNENEQVIAWFRVVFALPVLISALLFSGPPPALDRVFFGAYFAALPLDVAAILLYYRAIRISPLSLSLPFLSVTPVFLIIISFVVVGQAVSALGGVGIALIALGGYTLNLSALRSGFLAPIRAVARERGSLFMLIIAFLYGLTSSLEKIGVAHSSAPFFGVMYFLALAIAMTLIVAYRSGFSRLPGLFRSTFRSAFLPALFDSFAVVTHFYAISMANVAYMIAVKRTSLLFSVLYGFLLFKERPLRDRFLGSVLMFSGFVIITVWA